MSVGGDPEFDPATPLAPDVLLARFTANRKDIGTDERAPPRVKVAFMTPRREAETGRWALSTFRMDGLGDKNRHSFGQTWVERYIHPDRTVRACCALPVGSFSTAHDGLRAEFDNDPPRHVNILDWPDDEPIQLAISQRLCLLIETEGHRERY